MLEIKINSIALFILEGVSAIQAGLNPRVVEDLLKTYLPDNQRESAQEEEAA